MEQTREQVLNGLYALRAGLSVISVEYDKISDIKINRLKDAVAAGDKLQPYYSRIIKNSCTPETRRQWDNFMGVILAHGLDWYNILSDIYGENFKQADGFAARDSFFGKEFYPYESQKVGFEEEIKLYKYLYPNGNAAFADYFSENACGSTKGAMERYLLVEWLKSGYLNESLKAKIALQRGKLFGKKLLAELEQMQLDLPALQREINEAESKAAKSLKETIEGAIAWYNALQAQFSDLLDIRDWKHLDLVIYYFETRRADNVKEALQLVDREMQTQRIENLIVAATNQICNTIALGFNMLQNTMISCFNAISAKMNGAFVPAQTGADGAFMGNALKAKANVTSERIMDEVKHILCM